MSKIKYFIVLICGVVMMSCEDASELLNQHLKDGPIVYAGKIDHMNVQSGYYRVRVNLYPAEDVNRSHCKLSWKISNELKDSVIVNYNPDNYDEDLDCYYAIISLPSIEGNLLIEAQNVDVFGNLSLMNSEGAFIYGETYVSTLQNSSVHLSNNQEIVFENRIGAVGNLVSYEQLNGQFTDEIFIEADVYPLLNPKPGGIIRTKTGYLMNDSDIDVLFPSTYMETTIP